MALRPEAIEALFDRDRGRLGSRVLVGLDGARQTGAEDAAHRRCWSRFSAGHTMDNGGEGTAV